MVEIPALGFGAFPTPPDQTIAAVETALARGHRHIDTAAAYLNESRKGGCWLSWTRPPTWPHG